MKLFLSFALLAATAFAQTQYTTLVLNHSGPLDGSITVAGFPLLGLPFTSAPLPGATAPRIPIPSGWGNLFISGFCDGAEVGYVQGVERVGGASGGSQFSVPRHAALFSAPSYFFVDLQSEMNFSIASACDENMQVGTASDGTNAAHAVLWFGSPRSQVDLHTGPYLATSLTSVNAATNTQVGGGSLNTKVLVNGVEITRAQSHALLWHGTVKSLVDLNPAGWIDSFATQFGTLHQIGYADKSDGNNGGFSHAMIWTGTAASALDLHQFLPAGSAACSQAYFMDIPTGVISGTVGDCLGNNQQVLWIPQQ